MAVQAFQSTTQNKCAPCQFPELARKIAVRLPGGVNYPAGQVLGFRTPVATPVNEVQTATVSGTPSGGTFTLGFMNSMGSYDYTTAIAYNATVAAVQAAVDALLGSGSVVVGGSAGSWTFTFAQDYAGIDVPLILFGTNSLTGGTSPSVGIVETTKGKPAGGQVAAAYVDANADGTQTAKCVLETATQTDAAGRTINQFGIPGSFSAAAWNQGDFLVADLTGLDANGVADMGRLVSGNAFGDAGAIIRLT